MKWSIFSLNAALTFIAQYTQIYIYIYSDIQIVKRGLAAMPLYIVQTSCMCLCKIKYKFAQIGFGWSKRNWMVYPNCDVRFGCPLIEKQTTRRFVVFVLCTRLERERVNRIRSGRSCNAEYRWTLKLICSQSSCFVRSLDLSSISWK